MGSGKKEEARLFLHLLRTERSQQIDTQLQYSEMLDRQTDRGPMASDNREFEKLRSVVGSQDGCHLK